MQLDPAMEGWLAEKGYAADNPMEKHIDSWKAWVERTHAFYADSEASEDGMVNFKVDRISIDPAKIVAAEWTGLLVNEDLQITCPDDTAVQAEIEGLGRDGYLLRKCSQATQDAFSLGTAALVLRPEKVETYLESPTGKGELHVDVYAADAILPLNYDADSCTAAAFSSTVVIDGAEYVRLALHYPGTHGDYLIENALFKDGRRTAHKNVTDVIETHQPLPTFALFKPAVQNTYEPQSCMGISIIDSATAAVRVLDEAVNSAWRDLFLSEKMLVLPENFFRKDKDGKAIVPRRRGAQVFRMTRSTGDTDKPYEYNPAMRVEENRNAVKLGLELLGWRTGLGRSYWSFTDTNRGSTPTTATEVMASNADLFRNQKHHQTVLAVAISGFIRAYLSVKRSKLGAPIPDEYALELEFGDNVIEDTDTRMARMMALFNAGGLAAWELRAELMGESDEDAKAAVKEIAAQSNIYGPSGE
jgi:A118 family predicted phage portal protein